MLRVLDDWDSAYLEEIDGMDEGGDLDKKQAAGFTAEEIAKQVCGFANAGGGFVVFGMKDAKHGRGFDAGVPAMMGKGGREPVKSWVEGIIPKQHEPPIVGCQARLIQRPGQPPDRGVLVLYIPPSERRPHWVKGSVDMAYLRVGEHSAPMRHQTFLDIANRNVVPVVEIESLNVIKHEPVRAPMRLYILNPLVRVVSGPVCERWLFELRIPPGTGQFLAPAGSGSVNEDRTLLVLQGGQALFPARATMVSGSPFKLELADGGRDKDKPLEATLYTESPRPVRRTFYLRDLDSYNNLPG
jgi:Putative DNA-binding domain